MMNATPTIAALEAMLADERAARLQAERNLADCEIRMRALAQASTGAIWDWDLETGEVERGQEAAAIFGGSAAVEDHSVDWWKHHIYPDDRPAVMAAVAAAIADCHVSIVLEYRLIRADGSIAYLFDRGTILYDDSGKAARIVGATVDLTELKAARAIVESSRAQLAQATHNGALGIMASMIAHELNQPLTAIANYVRGSRRLVDASASPIDPQVDEALEAAESNALRAGQIMHRLRELVLTGRAARRTARLDRLIADAIAIVRYDGQPDAPVPTVTLAEDAHLAVVDRVQIQQVIANLVRNAADAVAGRADGTIAIEVSRSGGEIEIAVIDNGPGMSASRQKRLFAPMASVKPNGMGIGLSVCRAIVDAHGGRIWLAQGNEGHTEFRLTLPRANDVAIVDAPPRISAGMPR